MKNRSMKRQMLIVAAAALTAGVVILSGTSAATAQQSPQYEVGSFPITPVCTENPIRIVWGRESRNVSGQ